MTYFSTKKLLLGVLIVLLSAPGFAQVSPQSTAHWEKELTRQTDSTRKAEILLFISKEYQLSNPTLALAHAQHSYELGEKLKSAKIIGLASLQLSKFHQALGNKAKARRFRRRAEENLREVDLMAELNRLETQKSTAEENAQTHQAAAVTSQQRVTLLSSEARRNTIERTRNTAQLNQQSQMIGLKNLLLGKQDSVLTRRSLELLYQANQVTILEQEKALQAAEIEQQRTVRTALLAGGVLLLALAGLLWRLIANKQRTNRLLSRKNTQLDAARRRSDELLLNILPLELVEELKVSGITQTRHHDEVTIMFTDFKDFTQICEKLSPTELVQEIDHCFRHFDQIISKYPSIEKIKTIGDAYLCVGGLPEANARHATEVVTAALEIRNFILNLEAERLSAGKLAFQVRIGVHSGPVVAGVVGSTKFAYDIWGDTVNTASRLESAGEPGRVNISEATYQRIQAGFTCQYRGKIASKNKADMNMYYVESAHVLHLN